MAALKLIIFCLCFSIAASAQVPIHSINDVYTLELVIDGHAHLFLLDTGSSRTILRPGIVAVVNNNSISGKNLSGSNVMREGGHAKFTLGPKTFSVSVLVAPMPTDVPFDGILGMDVLSRFDSFTIDKKNHQLILY